jgi:hypothetical protein
MKACRFTFVAMYYLGGYRTNRHFEAPLMFKSKFATRQKRE